MHSYNQAFASFFGIAQNPDRGTSDCMVALGGEGGTGGSTEGEGVTGAELPRQREGMAVHV